MTKQRSDPATATEKVDRFLGKKWRIVAGDVGHREPSEPGSVYFALIERVDEHPKTVYKIYSREEKPGEEPNERFHQDLVYNATLDRLESAPDDPLGRCICYWEGSEATGRPDCIFAMRRLESPLSDAEALRRLLPWEVRIEIVDGEEKIRFAKNGSWGADGG